MGFKHSLSHIHSRYLNKECRNMCTDENRVFNHQEIFNNLYVISDHCVFLINSEIFNFQQIFYVLHITSISKSICLLAYVLEKYRPFIEN
jgi:hypothetical protein